MKSNCKFLYALAAFVLIKIFFLAFLFGIYGLNGIHSQTEEIDLPRAVELIESGEIRSVDLRNSQAILTTGNHQEFSTTIGSHIVREGLVIKIRDYNSQNLNNSISLSESPVTNSLNSMEYLFKLLFILFIISPPLIVLMLFLIWKELKKRNKLK